MYVNNSAKSSNKKDLTKRQENWGEKKRKFKAKKKHRRREKKKTRISFNDNQDKNRRD